MGNLTVELCTTNSTFCLGTVNKPNATITGSYGAYSVCSLTEQLSWSLNLNYVVENNALNASACPTSQHIRKRTPASLNSTCSALLAEAGPLGDGIVTGATINSDPSKLSKGAIVGIVVGVAVLLICLLAGGTFFFRKTKQTSPLPHIEEDRTPNSPDGTISKPRLHPTTAELGGNSVAEMETVSNITEPAGLKDPSPVFEAPDTSIPYPKTSSTRGGYLAVPNSPHVGSPTDSEVTALSTSSHVRAS